MFQDLMPEFRVSCDDMVNPNCSVTYNAHIKGLKTFLKSVIGGDPDRIKLVNAKFAKCKKLRITVNSVHKRYLDMMREMENT